MALSKTDIFNKTAVLLGAPTVSNATENSKVAVTLRAIYDMVRRSELRGQRPWNFSISMASLAASSTEPLFDRARSFPFPPDCLGVVAPFPEANDNFRDWIVQDGQIYTDYDSPLAIRYIQDVEDVTRFDPCFADALAAQLGVQSCVSITNSLNRQAACQKQYDLSIAKARKANAFDNVSTFAPLSTWITVRY